jgi:hypothetical protein
VEVENVGIFMACSSKENPRGLEMKPVISSIFISKAVEGERKATQNRTSGKTHLYLPEKLFYLLFPTIFHTGKITR